MIGGHVAVWLTDSSKAGILVEKDLVVSLCWIEDFECEMSQWDCACFHAEKFTDEQSEIMLDFDQKVGCLFHCNIQLFVLKYFFSSNHYKELIRQIDVSLKLKL